MLPKDCLLLAAYAANYSCHWLRAQRISSCRFEGPAAVADHSCDCQRQTFALQMQRSAKPVPAAAAADGCSRPASDIMPQWEAAERVGSHFIGVISCQAVDECATSFGNSQQHHQRRQRADLGLCWHTSRGMSVTVRSADGKRMENNGLGVQTFLA